MTQHKSNADALKKEEGTVIIDLDGQKYKISYNLNGQLLKQIFKFCNKSVYWVLKKYRKALLKVIS